MNLWTTCTAWPESRSVFFLREPPKDTVGSQLTTKLLDPASLVRSSRSASRWSMRAQATKWCLRKLQEAYRGIELPKSNGKIRHLGQQTSSMVIGQGATELDSTTRRTHEGHPFMLNDVIKFTDMLEADKKQAVSSQMGQGQGVCSGRSFRRIQNDQGQIGVELGW